MKRLRRHHVHYAMITGGIVLLLSAGLYGLVSGRAYFSTESVVATVESIKSFGLLTPAIIFAMILLPYAIPFFPIPAQFVEIAVGLIFGFWPGLFVAWASQMATAAITFAISDKLEHVVAKKIATSPTLKFFHNFLHRHGALAVFSLRATMSSPLNVSYLAGFSDMRPIPFLLATGFGVIPEVTLFVYIGTLIAARVELSIITIFAIVLGLTYLPTLAVMLYWGKRR